MSMNGWIEEDKLWCTPEVEKFYGFEISKTEKLFESWLQVLHPDDRAMAEAKVRRSLETSETLKLEYRIIRQNDLAERWLYTQADVVTDEYGYNPRIVGAKLDITETKLIAVELKKAKEDADAANKEKSRFLANVSHEIRSPLSIILGFSHLLKEGNLSKEKRLEFGSVIHTNGIQLQAVLDDILDLSKVEAGKLLVRKLHF